MKIKVFDNDSHVNEPPHVWESRLPKHLREKGPRMVEMPGGHQGWTIEGRAPRRVEQAGLAELAFKQGGMLNVDRDLVQKQMHDRPHRFDDYRPGNYQAGPRLEDMALDGVDASIIFPGVGANLWSLEDPELRVACMRAYNDWLIEELTSKAPDRLFGLADIPTDDGVETAVQELYRAAKMGHKGGFISVYPNTPWHDLSWDPLWAAAQEANFPLCWHRANGPTKNIPRGMMGGGTGPGMQAASVSYRFFSTIGPIIYMVFGGVFSRFPRLKIVTAETDVGWFPFLLQIVDDQQRRYGVWYGSESKRMPSEYLKENFFLTFMDDPVGVSMVPYMGADNILWSSDYPHGVTTWPKSLESIEKNMVGRTKEEREKILFGNALKLFGIKG